MSIEMLLPNWSVKPKSWCANTVPSRLLLARLEYASLDGVNDGSVDANRDGRIDGSDVTSNDSIPNKDFVDAMNGKFSPTGNFDHFGCHGSGCASQMNTQHGVNATGATGRTNYDPAGAGGRPERSPSGNYQNYPRP